MRLFLFFIFISLAACGPNGARSLRGTFEQTSTGEGFIGEVPVVGEDSVGEESVSVEPQPVAAVGCGSSQTCAMYGKINEIREANNRSELVIDEACQLMAQAHAEDMAAQGYFSHIGLDGSTPSTRVQRYGGNSVGENIAFGPSAIDTVAGMWMNSQGHRANILGNYRGTGVGSARGRRGTYWAQCFSR